MENWDHGQNLKQSDTCRHMACVSPWAHSAAIHELSTNPEAQECSHEKSHRAQAVFEAAAASSTIQSSRMSNLLACKWDISHSQQSCFAHLHRAVCPLLEMSMQQTQLVTRLCCTHGRHEDWQVTSATRRCAPSASSGPPSKVAFFLGKVQHIQYHLTGYIHSLLLSISQWSSGPELWRSLAFLASTQDGRAHQISFLSLIDNGNKSKAITHRILSSLRCCWMSAGTDAFSHKHFRYCFLHFG